MDASKPFHSCVHIRCLSSCRANRLASHPNCRYLASATISSQRCPSGLESCQGGRSYYWIVGYVSHARGANPTCTSPGTSSNSWPYGSRSKALHARLRMHQPASASHFWGTSQYAFVRLLPLSLFIWQFAPVQESVPGILAFLHSTCALALHAPILAFLSSGRSVMSQHLRMTYYASSAFPEGSYFHASPHQVKSWLLGSAPLFIVVDLTDCTPFLLARFFPTSANSFVSRPGSFALFSRSSLFLEFKCAGLPISTFQFAQLTFTFRSPYHDFPSKFYSFSNLIRSEKSRPRTAFCQNDFTAQLLFSRPSWLTQSTFLALVACHHMHFEAQALGWTIQRHFLPSKLQQCAQALRLVTWVFWCLGALARYHQRPCLLKESSLSADTRSI